MKVFKNDQWQLVAQIILAVVLFRFVLYKNLASELGLSDFYFLSFFCSNAIIIIGGMYLYRIVIQEENPHKQIIKNSEKAYYLYLALNIIGIGISFFVASAIEKTYYFGFFLAFAAIIYLYTTQWRKVVLFDNIIFAFIITFPILLEIFTDLLPSLDKNETLQAGNKQLLNVSIQLFILLWLLFFIKTIIQDLIFMQLDIRQNKRTLATIHGRETGAKRTVLLSLLPLIMILFFALYHQQYPLLAGYIVIAVIFPYIWYLYKLWNAKESKEFGKANNILSGIIWLTIFSIVILYFNFNE